MGKGQSFLIHGVEKTEDRRAKKNKKQKTKKTKQDWMTTLKYTQNLTQNL